MEVLHAGLVLLLFCSAYSYQFRSSAGDDPSVQDPELEWERMETVIGEEMMQTPPRETKFLKSASGSDSSTPEAMNVPQYVTVSASEDHEEVFKPEKGARPLPDLIKEISLVTATPTLESEKRIARMALVEILCHVDRIYVRIRREIFKTMDAYKYLTLGTCPVNQGTNAHYYLLYLLKTNCGFKKESHADYWSVRNVLHYKPTSPVLRDMPFDIPLQCKFPRFFNSYAVGFYPVLQGGIIFKALKQKNCFTLATQDASGKEITGTKTYTLGQPMYFEAKRCGHLSGSGDQRLYIHKCFMTASKNPNSYPKYTVIDNHGCMIDGKVTKQSKFLTCASKMVQKFSVGALIFKGHVSTHASSQQLYMHCEISMGKLTPTQNSKACNYDQATKKWQELYGYHSVCHHCASTCSSAHPKATGKIISSHPWKVLSSKDGDAEADPQMKSFDVDSLNLEDPDMAEHKDFLDHWEHDY
ncbi:zona pellucida sperm-binding protein 3 [Siniperca chuatsi]|uniref:zona pellucida sperm-binding protein 3 n=1 Tax=Siniperca chuatsi TaxID=119488 RepID=UPI001CE1A52D|nr:zona pellucida sperm-binding protein 3 [Siniperca chuatsi]